MAAAARRKIFWAWKRRALASVITLCGLVSREGEKRDGRNEFARVGRVPLQLALLGFIGRTGWVQQLGR